MCAWSDSITPQPALHGTSGELVSVRIAVEPRLLESLLEALAEVSFPVNPEIYHQAVVVCVSAGGRRESKPVTLVEFPAYRDGLAEVRNALETHGLDPDAIQVRSMLSEIQDGPKRGDVPWLLWGPAAG
jgi:hypothetical protein